MRLNRREALGLGVAAAAAFVANPGDTLKAYAKPVEFPSKEPYLSPLVLAKHLDEISAKYPSNSSYGYSLDRNYYALATEAGQYLEEVIDTSGGTLGIKWPDSITLPSGEWMVSSVLADQYNDSIKTPTGISYTAGQLPFLLSVERNWSAENPGKLYSGRGLFRISAVPSEQVTIPKKGVAVRLSPNYLQNPDLDHAELTAKLSAFQHADDPIGAIEYVKNIHRKNPSIGLGADAHNNPLKPGQWLIANAGAYYPDGYTALPASAILLASKGRFLFNTTFRLTVLGGERVLFQTDNGVAIYLGGPTQTIHMPLVNKA